MAEMENEMNNITEALEKNNTTAGRLTAVLAIADKLCAQNAELVEALERVTSINHAVGCHGEDINDCKAHTCRATRRLLAKHKESK